MGPIVGTISDHTGRRKPWLFASTLGCSIACGFLWPIIPDESMVLLALILIGAANITFELGMVFYKEMLADLVSSDRIGRVSGWGWGTGYAGGLICLVLVLVLFVQTETLLFDLIKDVAEHLRAVGPFVAIWMVLFAVPIFCSPKIVPQLGLVGVKLYDTGSRSLFRR